MENNAFKDENFAENDQQNTFGSFVCCVCLDLLHKPIVLSCGHIACFWCVRKSMNGLHESRCPICRHPYYHFPAVCQLLHFLLLKMYPVAYKIRENQMLEEEKKTGFFSPQFDAYTCGSQAEFDDPRSLPPCTIVNTISNSCSKESLKCMEQSETATHKGDEGTIYSGHTSKRTPEVIGTPVEAKKLPQNKHNQQQKISVADLMCTTCKQLLFRPVVLNCGHVHCETCMINFEVPRCQVCQSAHPRGFPKVCLELNHFLEEQFPEEYAQQRDAVQLSQIKVKPKTTSSECSMNQSSCSCFSDLGSTTFLICATRVCDHKKASLLATKGISSMASYFILCAFENIFSNMKMLGNMLDLRMEIFTKYL